MTDEPQVTDKPQVTDEFATMANIEMGKGDLLGTFVLKEHADGRITLEFGKVGQTYEQALSVTHRASNRQKERTFYLINVIVADVIGAKGRMP